MHHGSISEKDREIFLQGLLKGNRAESTAIVQALQDTHTPLQSIYEELFRESLYTVGELWEHNRISVASEHMATAIVEGIMNTLYTTIEPPLKAQKKVLLSCVEQETHQVGLRMIADIFEISGWDTIFLGSGIPTEELIRFIDEQRVDLLALSLSIYFHMNDLHGMLSKIRDTHPTLPILIGGQAFRHGGREIASLFEGVTFITSIAELEGYLGRHG